jgi:hypothetical protein
MIQMFMLDGRQRNVDYAFCQATKTIVPEQGLLAIYDIACQWSIHLKERIRKGRFLSMPDFEEFLVGIGKFHLGGHILECFPKFSLNFILGAGQLDGEILETLWAPIDKVAPITRTMTKAHRREVLDDNMLDSNWKKWVGIGTTYFYCLALCAKFGNP